MRKRSAVWRVLASPRRFGLFVAGATLSNIGTWCQNVAAIILVFRLTEDTSMVAMVSIAQYAAVISLGPYAGVVADRFDRRKILAFCQIGGVVASVVLAWVAFNATASVLLILSLIALLGCAQAFQGPAMLATTPSLVALRDRDIGLSMNAMQFNLARIIGPIVASLLIATAGIGWAFVVNAGSYWVFLVTLAFIKPRKQRRSEIPPTLASGFEAVRGARIIIMLLLVGLIVNGATDIINTLGPALSTKVSGSDELAGVFIAAFGLGAVVMAVAGVPYLRRYRATLFPQMVLGGVSIVTFSAALNPGLSIASAFVFGAVFLGVSTKCITLIQEEVEEGMIGRVMALWLVAILGGRALFAMVQAVLVQVLGPSVVGYIIAGIVLSTAVFFRFVRKR